MKQNIRLNALKNDRTADSSALSYPGFLLSEGEGSIPVETEDIIRLPQHLNAVKTLEELIDSVFPDMCKKYTDVEWLTSRAILASTHAAATSLNEEIGNRIPGEYRLLRSADSVTADVPDQQAALELRYPEELLNSLDTGSSMSDHMIKLKKVLVVVLLRNIRPKQGHVNGTRYVVINMTDSLPFLQALSGTNQGESFLLPRINCLPGMEEFLIPGFRRSQFPVRVSFAMTVNKAQGQSVSVRLGLDLTHPCIFPWSVFTLLYQELLILRICSFLLRIMTELQRMSYSQRFLLKVQPRIVRRLMLYTWENLEKILH